MQENSEYDAMKLKQKEFCHNCNQYVEFEFEDTELKQVIHCPICNHEHYRELDGGTITGIRVANGTREIRQHVFRPCSMMMSNKVDSSFLDIEVETKEVIAVTEDGAAIIKGGDKMVVTNRRWGRDASQG